MNANSPQRAEQSVLIGHAIEQQFDAPEQLGCRLRPVASQCEVREAAGYQQRDLEIVTPIRRDPIDDLEPRPCVADRLAIARARRGQLRRCEPARDRLVPEPGFGEM